MPIDFIASAVQFGDKRILVRPISSGSERCEELFDEKHALGFRKRENCFKKCLSVHVRSSHVHLAFIISVNCNKTARCSQCREAVANVNLVGAGAT